MTLVRVQISLFWVESCLMSKIGSLAVNFLCLVCLWKPAATTVVASKVLSCHRYLGCFKKAGVLTHFSLISLGSRPRLPWSAGFRVVRIWCHCSWWPIVQFSVSRFATNVFCCFVDFILSDTTWMSVQTCETALLLRWSSLSANDKRLAPIVSASKSSFGKLSCLIGATLLWPIKNLHSMTASSKLCIRKNRTEAIPMSEASVNACISKFHDLLLWFGNKILKKKEKRRKESRNFCSLCWRSLGI